MVYAYNGMLFSLQKGNKILTQTTIWINLENVNQSEEDRHCTIMNGGCKRLAGSGVVEFFNEHRVSVFQDVKNSGDVGEQCKHIVLEYTNVYISNG